MIERNVPLKDYSYMKIGGPAKFFLDFYSLDELSEGMREWREITKKDENIPKKIFVIGTGTNILFDDDGFDGLILRNSITGIKNLGENEIEIGAGTTMEEINKSCIENSLSGLEWSGGLPGTIGGAVFGNAGAFGGEIKDVIQSVKSYDLDSGEIIDRSNVECEFDYRNSIFKSKNQNEMICSAILNLEPGDPKEISIKTEEKSNYRVVKQPLDFPTLGSTFKNIDIKLFRPEVLEKVRHKIKDDPFPIVPVAYLIHLAGLAGTQIGGVQISEKHPNFFINLGSGTAQDVRELIALVQKKIEAEFGVVPEPEIRDLGK